MARIVGKYNEIHEDAKIAETARICGWCYIGPGVEIGENTVIGNYTEINSGVKIGSNTMINAHCIFTDNVKIGDGTIIGGGVNTADEKYMTARTSNIQKQPCLIGNDCRVGQNSSLICTKLGDHVSIGAGSVVLEPVIKPYEVWAGVPARYLRSMSDHELSI